MLTNNLAPRDPATAALQGAEMRRLEAQRPSEQFLPMLGHEMRNPLSALSYALQVWPQLQDDPVQMEELRQIMERQVQHLTRLSDDLLDVTRVSQGTIELRRETVDLRQLLDAACEEVGPFIASRGHELTVSMPDKPVYVYGDASRLLQVFANLIQNAAKFTDRDGNLRVAVESQEEMAVIRIRDNGRGLEEHMLQAIFRGNTQVNGTAAQGNDGLGIGLRLVKTIAELHGGSVAAQSDGLGCGSEFVVRLPVMRNAAQNMQPAEGPPAASGRGNGQHLAAHPNVVANGDRSMA